MSHAFKRVRPVYIACILAVWLAGDAAAQRMRDMSLSPEESLQQPNISHAQPGYNQANPYQAAPPAYSRPSTGQDMYPAMPDNPYGAGPANSFMTAFCDPAFHPVVAGNSALAACMATQKQQACTAFRQLPAAAKGLLDQAIDCAYAAGNADAAAAPATYDCAAYDSRRLELLKTYWQDSATAHALIFMPDEVLGGDSLCLRGR